MTYQVAQEDEAALEQSEYEQVPVGIGRRDVRAQLLHTRRDRAGIKHDALHGPTIETGIRLDLLRFSQTRAHTDTRSTPIDRTGTAPRDRGKLLEPMPPHRRPAPPATAIDRVRESGIP